MSHRSRRSNSQEVPAKEVPIPHGKKSRTEVPVFYRSLPSGENIFYFYALIVVLDENEINNNTLMI